MKSEFNGSPQAAFAAFSGLAAFSSNAAFAAFSSNAAFAAFGLPESPVAAEAFLTNRDGIVGAPIGHIGEVVPGVPNDVRNLSRLSRDVRASIYAFELGTKVELTVEQAETATAVLWRREAGRGHRPNFKYRELVQITAPTMEVFKHQMEFLTGYADIRQDRAAEILSQVSAPVPFFQTISFMDPARTPYTLEYLATALRFAGYVEQQMKYALAVKRPIELSPQVQPMIPTPTHGSLPSGHATESFVIARLLWKLMRHSGVPQYQEGGHWGEMLMRLAARIAGNRTVAGVHFPVDSSAGAVLGLTLADFVHAQSTGSDWTSATFDGLNYSGSSDFDWHKLYVAADDQQLPKAKGPDGVWATAKTHEDREHVSPALAWLWKKAQAEWVDLT